MVDANAFYPSMAPAVSPPATSEPASTVPEVKQEAPAPDASKPTPSSKTDLAEALYGNGEPLPELEVPPAVKELRKADDLRGM